MGPRWMTRVAIGLLGAFAITIGFAFLALRDNPARPASGERRVAESAEAAIHYFVAGPVEGSVVVLIPSYARSASDFNELVLALGHAGHRTIAIQPRGIDSSGPVSFSASLHTFARDVRSVLAAEGLDERVVVLGHAYGNRVARTFGTDFPEQTRALVLLAAGGKDPTPPEMTKAITRALFGFYPESIRREAIELAFFAEGQRAPSSWLAGWYPLAGIAQAGATTATPFSEWGSGGTSPILVLQPEEDVVASLGGERLAQRFPDRVRLVSIAGTGHALLPERPEEIERAIVDYLGTLP